MTTELNVELRKQWSEERAYRAGIGVSYTVFGLTLVFFCVNLIEFRKLAIAYDIILLVGSLLSVFLTRRTGDRRRFVWWPVYSAALITYILSAWFTGGLYSPWMGMYLAMMLILGAVIQTRIGILKNFIFISLHVPLWFLAHKFFLPGPPAGLVDLRPLPVMMIGAWVFLIGLSYAISFLFRAERELSAEIDRRYAELYETKASLAREEAANQAKSAFLANVSHELRTPLGAIMGYTNFLQEENLNQEERSNFVGIIERNGRQLARLVNDLLDLSKIEAGQLEIEKLEFSLRDVISDVLLAFGPQANQKNLDLKLLAGGPLPRRVRGDPYRLKQLLMNVVGNAVKFTDRGAIQISVECSRAIPLTVRVRDTGRGIPSDKLDKLFKPFSQCDASMTRVYGGTGLGLHYSRKLAQLMGGDLELIHSEPGIGSEFEFWIPVEVLDEDLHMGMVFV